MDGSPILVDDPTLPQPVRPATTVTGTMCALHVVLAPNAFKGTLTADQAAEAMRRGLQRAMPTAVCLLSPIADGGDGSVEAFLSAGHDRRRVRVRDAVGHWHEADMAVRGNHAVIEVANTCGVALLGSARHPMTSSTLGLGDALRGALDEAATGITVCLGGSASTDGGAGMLVALGARLLDDAGRELEPCGETLGRVARLDLSGVDQRIRRGSISAIADVTSPLYGPDGAAHVFAPQKGASPDEVQRLDDGLRNWGRVLTEATGRDVVHLAGVGAAGGTGAALAAVFGAVIESSDTLLRLIDLPRTLLTADLVITGEGCLDASTLAGKGCAGVIEMARLRRTAVLAVCGSIDLTSEELAALGVAGARATDEPGPSAADSVAAATEAAIREWWGGPPPTT